MLSFDFCYCSVAFNAKIIRHQNNREPVFVVSNDLRSLSICFMQTDEIIDD